jgi:Pyridoxamine 5'-phosphate oxidase
VIASVRPDGTVHSAATAYEWTDAGTILVNMDGSRRRLDYMRANPHVALTIFVGDDWYSHISITGRVIDVRPDPGIVDMDRIAMNYSGEPYHDRARDSWSAEIAVESWHSWDSTHDAPIDIRG